MLRHGQQHRGRADEELNHAGIPVDLPHLQVCTTPRTGQSSCAGGREWSRRATQVSDLAASCPEKSRTSSLSVQASPFKETLSVPLNRSWPAFRANTCYERRRFTRSNDPAWNGHDLDLLEDHRFKAVPLLS